MKNEIMILWGDKNFKNKLKYYKLTKKEILHPIKKWLEKIDSKEKFDDFQKYLIKTISRLEKDYSYINLSNLDKMSKILITSQDWRRKQKEILRLMDN